MNMMKISATVLPIKPSSKQNARWKDICSDLYEKSIHWWWDL